MHTIWNRANALFAYAVYVVSIMIGICVVTAYFLHKEPNIDIRLHKVTKFGKTLDYYNTKLFDSAEITFNLNADLRPIFNWNVKQIFVFVTAEYKTKSNKVNQLVVWDRIIQNTTSAHINVVGETLKYNFVDIGNDLRNNSITLTVKYDVSPISGILFMKKGGETKFTLPSSFTKLDK